MTVELSSSRSPTTRLEPITMSSTPTVELVASTTARVTVPEPSPQRPTTTMADKPEQVERSCTYSLTPRKTRAASASDVTRPSCEVLESSGGVVKVRINNETCQLEPGEARALADALLRALARR